MFTQTGKLLECTLCNCESKEQATNGKLSTGNVTMVGGSQVLPTGT